MSSAMEVLDHLFEEYYNKVLTVLEAAGHIGVTRAMVEPDFEAGMSAEESAKEFFKEAYGDHY